MIFVCLPLLGALLRAASKPPSGCMLSGWSATGCAGEVSLRIRWELTGSEKEASCEYPQEWSGGEEAMPSVFKFCSVSTAGRFSSVVYDQPRAFIHRP